MSAEVMLVVLLGAALHATWNVLVKSGTDKTLDLGLVVAGSALFALLAVPFLPMPAPASWPMLAASGLIHWVYFALVAAAYRIGDMSLAYPLMRGTPPMVVAVLGSVLLGDHLRAGGWAGVAMVSAGVLATALQRHGKGATTVIPVALANALVIVAYTLVDGLGARHSGHAVAYTLWVFLLTALLLLPPLVWRRGATFAAQARARWRFSLGGGLCTLGSYTVALWAMTQAPIALVSALRETSILFGVALAGLLLGERPGRMRLAGVGLITLGAAVLRLA